MKKPTLRFRQVFEHPTHFKVTKPLGNPMIIAKKGLSPSLQTRLRKFAQGGEVRGYADGGDVQDDFSTLPPAITTSPEAKQLQDQDIKSFMDAFTGSGGDEPPVPQPATPAVVPAPAVAPTPVLTAPVPVEPMPAAEVAPPVKAEPIAAAPEPEAKPVEAEKPEAAAAVDEGLAEIGLDRNRLAQLTTLERAAAMNYVKASAAAKAQAKMDTAAAEQDVDKMQQEYTQQETELTRLRDFAKEAHDTERSILQEYDHLKNPQDYFSNLSTGDQIATAIGLMLGAFASGITKTPNAAMAIYNSTIENDLARQKRQSDSLYQRLVAAGHSTENAEQLYRAQMKLVGAAELNRRGALAKLSQVKARIQTESAKFVSDALRTYAQVAKDERAAVTAEQKAPFELGLLGEQLEEKRYEKTLRPMQKRKMEAETKLAEMQPAALLKRLKNEGERLALDRERMDQSRQDRLEAAADKKQQDEIASELDIGDNVLHLKSKTRAPMIRDNIASRQQGIMAAMKLEKLFSTQGMNVFNPASDKRGEAIAELNTLVEIFPKIEGFQRAISVSAKEQLKLALQDPASMGAALKQIFLGRDPAVGVRAVLEEGKRSYADQVRIHAREPMEEREAAVKSFFKKAEQEIEKYGRASLPTEALYQE
jgi:hypothetical protein